MVGTVLEVLTHTAADFVDTVETGQCSPMTVGRGYAAPGAQQPRADDAAACDRLTQVHVQEVLLGHHPHGGRARHQVALQIGRRA